MKQVIIIKKSVIYAIVIISCLAFGFVLSSLLSAFDIFTLIREPVEEPAFTDEKCNAVLTELAYDVLKYIRDDDFHALSQVAHPEFGVVFSPSATINLTANKRFNASQISAMTSDSSVYIWGVYEVSGEPIEMTPAEYFADFIPARSFIDAPVIGVNRIVRSGQALENITEVFPDARFVDFHIPNGDRDSTEEPDWISLRLGFEDYNGRLRLIVIIFSRRTV